ncbi:MAG: 50S ribosomal protein L19 [Candidatus Komeilibacteria bacterium RIFCSPLOWO2_01_FULL_53_11]|uniref:50S ribosomal protein L19 n=1 Tax=Candidatus Komeilibacteria bacterium RIFCSPLOWO2_01_FULL_53_11 TaxID=1798552 RepID=A0A1G2BTD3_9BACT|nr:MAG: 50S ribosomal protein L19 [Candidatus Komeilibacteria bacterium RIFCSPLOWO2_01_FULL_53_11]
MADKKAAKEQKGTKHHTVSLDAIRPGATVRVHQVLTEKNAKGEEKKRIQIFEGIVLARKHGSEAGATITVRKVSEGIGVEKIFPLNSPWIKQIETIQQARVRRAKLSYLRSYRKRLKEKAIAE